MGINMIAAVSRNWGIGNKNKLLFSIPEDMRFFREKTLGSIVIMGRKTLESFPGGKPLKNRTNIVITKNSGYQSDAIICTSKEDVLKKLNEFKKQSIFVIGGESIYRLFEDVCDTAYITKVRHDAEADTFFPDLDMSTEWVQVFESELHRDNGYEFTFCTYMKKGTVE